MEDIFEEYGYDPDGYGSDPYIEGLLSEICYAPPPSLRRNTGTPLSLERPTIVSSMQGSRQITKADCLGVGLTGAAELN